MVRNVTYHNPINQEENTPLVTITELRIDLKMASAIDSRKARYQIDLAKASFGGISYPQLGTQWYLKKISGVWTLMARAPQQNPQLGVGFDPAPGDVFIGQGGTTTVVGDLVITGSGGGSTDPLDVYPVDSIYLSLSATFDPNVTWGGTWVTLENSFLLGAGDLYALAATGGSTTHTLVTNNLPSHSHAVGTLANAAESSHTHGVGTYDAAAESSHTHGVGTYDAAAESSHTHGVGTYANATTGAHKHTLNRDDDGQIYSSGTRQWVLHSVGTGGDQTVDTNVGSNGDHTHTISGSSAAGSSHDHALSGSSDVGSSHDHALSGASAAGDSHNHTISGSTATTGSGTAVDHMPPYLAVFMWRRTA